MDEIGNEFNDESENDKTEEELPELTSESDEPDEFDNDIPEIFSEPNEFDDDIPETFSGPDEFDDDIPETFSEPDEFDDDIPETFSEPDEFDDDIPETFSEPDEFDDDIPEIFSEPDEFDDDIPEVFSETDEIDDNLDDVIQDKEDNERANEDQDSGHVENVIENENIGSQSTSTVLTSEIEEIESNMGHQEQEEQIEILPEEYQEDTEPIVNTDESEFIKDVEELAEYAREIKAEDENVEPQAEQENAAYYAEQYYETLKEKEVVNDQDSKEGQETEELKQEVTEELNGHQEGGCESDKLEEEEIIEASEEIISTEEFEYLWEIRDKLDQEGKTSEEIEDVMHEAEEMYETLKNAEKIYEELQQENLKRVDHEDEASEEDLKEDLDRVDLIEQVVELEEKLVQQGESQEEIDMKVEESIEATKIEERSEKIIKQQELERLKRVDHEDEANEEDLKEDLDRADLIEQVVELEEKLVQQGEMQEEIDVRVEESIEATKFEERLETIIEQQELEKLKRVDHEDEANEEDLKEDLDRVDLIEQAVELEEKLVQQGESQEEIDLKVEESIEATKLEERSEKIIEKERHELKTELDAIESVSEGKKDLLEEITKLGSEESDEEENERLQELYGQETGRRPIYAKKKTKGYSQWLEQQELGSEKIKNSKSESEKIKEIREVKEEDWKTTLKQWIKEASEEECNAELKSELKKALESYNEFEALTRKFMELFEKSQHEKLSEKEKITLKSLTERLQELDPIKLELLTSVFFIKKYITEQYWWDFWNKYLVNRVLSKFFKHISQKYKELRKEQKSEQEGEIMRNNVLLKQIIKEVESIEEVENVPIEEKLEQKIELEEYKDYQQELEDALEEYRKIEVRASVEIEEFEEELTDIESESEETSDEEEYEQVKQIYRQQTGRRPIYKGEQTKGFGKWLEERNELENELIDPKQQKINITPINTGEIPYTNEKNSTSKIGDLISKKSKLNQKEIKFSIPQKPIFFNPEELINTDVEELINESKKFLTGKQFNEKSSKKEIISGKIRNLLFESEDNILNFFSNLCVDKEFFLQLIRKIFLILKNETKLLDRLSVDQLKKIPPVIYNIAKDISSYQGFAHEEKKFLKKIRNLCG
jgi:hypothetical protein